MPTRIQFRRDTAANWTSANPTLASGELGLETDTGAYKVGDGSTAWTSLSYWALPATVNTLLMNNQSDPSAPGANTMDFYAKAISGRMMPKWKGPSGLDCPVQPAIFQSSLFVVVPNTTTSVTTLGGAVTSVGTLSTPTPTTTSHGVATNFVSGATAGNTAGTGSALAYFARGSDNALAPGFFTVQRLLFPDANYGTGATGCRFFVGLTDQTLANSVGSDNPSGHRAGFALSTNLSETNWMFSTKDGTTETRTSTGMALTVNKLYDFFVFCPPGGSTVYWRVDNLTDITTASGSTTANLPGTGTLMRVGFQIATLTTTARNVRMKKIYAETDL